MGIKQWWNSERLEIIKIGFQINYSKKVNCHHVNLVWNQEKNEHQYSVAEINARTKFDINERNAQKEYAITELITSSQQEIAWICFGAFVVFCLTLITIKAINAWQSVTLKRLERYSLKKYLSVIFATFFYTLCMPKVLS